MTPANLRAARMRLGLSLPECAAILGLEPKALETQERAKSINVYAAALARLQQMESEMESLRDAIMRRYPPPAALVGYMSTEELHAFEPDIARRLILNSVHRMALAQCQSDMQFAGLPVSIVEIIPEHYRGWLERHQKPDTPAAREAWAIEKAATFRVIPANGEQA